MGTLPKIFHTLFLWGHSQQCVIYFFFMHPPVVRMSGDKKRWCTPPMGVDGLARSQLIKQDSFIYIYTFFQCFALSGLPSFFKTYIYLWHLFDRYFPDIYLINKYDIDSRNSKNPTCTHTHCGTPPTKPLYPPVSSSSVSSTRVWAWGLSELIKHI